MIDGRPLNRTRRTCYISCRCDGDGPTVCLATYQGTSLSSQDSSSRFYGQCAVWTHQQKCSNMHCRGNVEAQLWKTMEVDVGRRASDVEFGKVKIGHDLVSTSRPSGSCGFCRDPILIRSWALARSLPRLPRLEEARARSIEHRPLFGS